MWRDRWTDRHSCVGPTTTAPWGPPHPEGPDLGLLGAVGTQVWKGFYPRTLGHLTSTQGEMHIDLQSSGDRHLAASPRKTPS